MEVSLLRVLSFWGLGFATRRLGSRRLKVEGLGSWARRWRREFLSRSECTMFASLFRNHMMRLLGVRGEECRVPVSELGI